MYPQPEGCIELCCPPTEPRFLSQTFLLKTGDFLFRDFDQTLQERMVSKFFGIYSSRLVRRKNQLVWTSTMERLDSVDEYYRQWPWKAGLDISDGVLVRDHLI